MDDDFKKNNVMRYTVVIFINFSISFAQISVPFKTRYQGFIKGDMTIIANNIVNRIDYNNTPNDPYYNHTNQAQQNDDFNMQYIDVDKEEDTFSSSNAELFLENQHNKKIVYAGLYWSATYKYNYGLLKNTNKYVAQEDSRENFNTIKIKFPNQEKYTIIEGETLFDGIKDSEFKDLSPYVAYADITSYVNQLKVFTGVYTVANIRATQGRIKGGVAGGWTILFVYEDASMSEKFIKTQDGFAGITEKPTDIIFNGFETQNTGNINVKIACSALEGDNNSIGDQLLIGNIQSNKYIPLNNLIRKENNFFNSSITIDDDYFYNRFPDSKNTLGYDAFLFTIPNQNNSIIQNNDKEVVLRFKSQGDNYFLFFTAFQLERQPITSSESTKMTSLKEAYVPNFKLVPINNDLMVDDKKTISSINRIKKNNALANNTLEIYTLNSSSPLSGYYLLVNIFKSEQQTQEFIYFLKSKKISAAFFVNPLNSYFYVYLQRVDTAQQAIELFTSKMNDTYLDPIQIVVINNDNKPNAISNEEKVETQKTTPSEALTTELSTSVKTSINNNNLSKEPKESKEIVSNDFHIATIPNEPKGYYVVVNVFAVSENSNNFIKYLKTKGFNPKVLVNTTNNYKYIYLQRVDSQEEAKRLLDSKYDNKYGSKIWVLSVNNSSN